MRAPERNVLIPELLTDIMRRKLFGGLGAKKVTVTMDLEKIKTRASSAYRELQEAWHFQYVIPNRWRG